MAIHKQKIVLTATDNHSSISWGCAGDGIEKKHLPAACRDDFVGKKKKKKKKSSGSDSAWYCQAICCSIGAGISRRKNLAKFRTMFLNFPLG